MKILSFSGCWPQLFKVFKGAGIVLIGCLASSAMAVPPAPLTDYFKHDYGVLLPAVPDAELLGYTGRAGAADTGDGGWLTFWGQSSPSGENPYNERLMVRLLPPGVSRLWEGAAHPALDVGELDSPILPVTATGEGGAWLAWASGGEIKVGRFEQATGAQNGPLLGWPVSSPPQLLLAAGSGQHAWVLTAYTGAGPTGPSRIRVLGKTAGKPAVTASTPLPTLSGGGFIFSHLTAAFGKCLLSGDYETAGGRALRTVTVDINAQTSPVRELTLPAGSIWLGAAADGSGFTGFWTVPYPLPFPQLIYSRSIAPDGTWRAGSQAALVAPLASTGHLPVLVAGEDRALFQVAGVGTYLWTNDRPLQLVSSDTPPSETGDDFVLRVAVENDGAVRAARLSTLPGTMPPLVVTLSLGTGDLNAPALAWTPRGLQVTGQLRRYRPPGAGTSGTGFNVTAGVGPGLGQVLHHPGFSTPAQSWREDGLQLIAYRRNNAEVPNISPVNNADDVVGVLYRTAADGTVSPVRGPFVIGGGTGSQRGVSVARMQDGFVAAWRETIPPTGDSTALSAIRAAFIYPSGEVQPPNGRIIDIGIAELSAVSVADGGRMVWRSSRSLVGEEPSIIRSAQFNRDLPAFYLPDLSSIIHNAVAPQVLLHGDYLTHAWRDKFTRRIFVIHRKDSLAPVAVSPDGERAREPVLAALGEERAAVLWLEEDRNRNGPSRIWIAIIDPSGVSGRALVASGFLDPDTLVAEGDGKGRIGIAFKQLEGRAYRLKTLVIAPEVRRDGGLRIAPIRGALPGSNQFLVSWETSAIFPGKIATAQSSGDLKNWLTSGEMPMVGDGPGRLGWLISLPGVPSRYYRLRAVLVPGP